MPYRRYSKKGFNLRPVLSEKHYIPIGPSTTTSGAMFAQSIAVATHLADVNNATEVPLGSHVKAIFIELWVTGAGATGTVGQFDLLVGKPKEAEHSSLTAAQSLLPNDIEWKNRIFLKSKGNIIASVDGGLTPALRGWIKVPKALQRMAQSDRLMMYITASSFDLEFCGVITYKYFM